MFRFKRFEISDSNCAMKVGTDGVLLGAWVDVAGVKSILDAGTGSGLIAMMIAQRNDEADIMGIELDAPSAADAAFNVKASEFSDRIEIINADFNLWTPSEKFDLIVSNPPFFTENLRSPDSQRAGARHEDEFGAEALMKRAHELLHDDGQLAMVLPSSRDNDIEFHAELHRLYPVRRCRVISVAGKSAYRTLWQFSISNEGPCKESELILRMTDGSYSEEFNNMTSHFYLDKYDK